LAPPGSEAFSQRTGPACPATTTSRR
jgi:hypothetical protein